MVSRSGPWRKVRCPHFCGRDARYDEEVLVVGGTSKNGALHYPTHVSRLQFGIWDASSPAGTSEWARGPIDWNKAPRRMSAVFESIQVECPYGQ